MKKLRTFTAEVTYRDRSGVWREDTFPVTVQDYLAAKELALQYAVEVLRLRDFELRIVGA